MVICLESSVLSGYLSNEVPGLVTGLLHLAGQSKALRIELEGNFLRDIAGCRVDFHNPCPESDAGLLDALHLVQTGHTGMMTGSYRVAILPRRRSGLAGAAGSSGAPLLRAPSGLKNLVFFEWFNLQGQRVLMQSWHLMLSVSAPRWQLDREEEKRLLRAARARRRHYLLESRRQRSEAGQEADPFVGDLLQLPPDAEAGEDPFTAASSPPAAKGKKGGSKPSPTDPLPDPFQRSEALAAELRRFEALLIYQNNLQSQPAMLKLLATVADLAAHLGHALRQFVVARRQNWDFLIVDLEQSLPLFGAALSATERLVAHPSETPMDRNWLGLVQSCLLGIELRMRELLTLLR